ncbi:MAG: ATP-binding protein [Clostridia bacterium]|jgi:predicted AAA+ superfamily ATPase|nr:ATP-binding protein [Clostridia bacterium]
MQRKFYEVLTNWKEKNINTPLMVIGARQIGKTYIINEFCNNEFEDYIYINLMEKQRIVKIFEEDSDFEVKVKKLELELNRKIIPGKTIVFIDEIQESEKAISSLKAFCESNLEYRIICAGSLLGVKIRRFKSSFPVGKVQIEFMHPMDFEEFLIALDRQMWVDEIKKCYEKLEEISIHEKLLDMYRTYLCIGGMPSAVLDYKNSNEDILLWNKKILKNIVLSYLADMNKYTLNNSESVKIEKVYNTIPSSLAKENKKFKYADIEKGANKRGFESAIDWLIASEMVYKCKYVNKVEQPLKVYAQDDIFKLYLSDIGMLTSLLEIEFAEILLNENFMFKGAIVENYVAQAFIANNISLYYWNSGNKAEVDFLLYNKDGIIPVEVKAGDNTQSKSLNIYKEKYSPKYSIRLSTKNFGFANGIKSIPLYATFCIH